MDLWVCGSAVVPTNLWFLFANLFKLGFLAQLSLSTRGRKVPFAGCGTDQKRVDGGRPI